MIYQVIHIFQMLKLFFIDIFIITLVSPLTLSENSWSYKTSMQILVFLILIFLLERSNFIIDNKLRQFFCVFFFKVTNSFCSFFKKYLPGAQDQITIVFLSVILSSKKSVPWKSTQFTLQQLNHTSTFPADNLCHTSICRSVLCILSILSPRILKRHVFRGWDLVKINYF